MRDPRVCNDMEQNVNNEEPGLVNDRSPKIEK